MYCPDCKTKLLLHVELKLPVDYAEIPDIEKLILMPTLIITSVLRITDFDYAVIGLKCWNCGKVFDSAKEVLVSSQLTSKFIKLSDACVISEKASDNEVVDNRVKVVRPPKIIAISEIDTYKRTYNPIESNIVMIPLENVQINKLF